jgi:F0F1-type ATP synthase assembly protein I
MPAKKLIKNVGYDKSKGINLYKNVGNKNISNNKHSIKTSKRTSTKKIDDIEKELKKMQKEPTTKLLKSRTGRLITPLAISADILAGIFTGLFLGMYLDYLLDTLPFFLCFCTIFGGFGGLYNLYKSVMKKFNTKETSNKDLSKIK